MVLKQIRQQINDKIKNQKETEQKSQEEINTTFALAIAEIAKTVYGGADND